MKNGVKKTIKSTINSLGFELKRINVASDIANPETLFEIDRDFNDLYDLAHKKTLSETSNNPLRRQRHYVLYYLLRQVDIHQGNIAECGCWKGLTAYQIATYLRQSKFRNKFYLFDSFEGLSEFEDCDLPSGDVIDKKKRMKYFACSLEAVRENLKDFDFIDYKKGWIPERFKDVENEKFVFVNIEVDLYQPTRDSLDFFYDKTVKNGIIGFGDYGCVHFPGVKKAVGEFMKDKKDFFLSLPSGYTFLIKR